MMLLLKLIAITSILIMAFKIASDEGMLLWPLKKWAMKKKEEGAKWASPLFLCHLCMPSSFALIAFGFAYGMGVINHLEWKLIFYYVLTVGGSSILNWLVWNFHSKMEAEQDYFISLTERMYEDDEFYEDGVPDESFDKNHLYSHN